MDPKPKFDILINNRPKVRIRAGKIILKVKDSDYSKSTKKKKKKKV